MFPSSGTNKRMQKVMQMLASKMFPPVY
uniref:Uncharacterized protein n=1 Tax=Rhizophora mucronata TaxID=61149 RepID=A0A2P2NBE6_RHIMU